VRDLRLLGRGQDGLGRRADRDRGRRHDRHLQQPAETALQQAEQARPVVQPGPPQVVQAGLTASVRAGPAPGDEGGGLRSCTCPGRGLDGAPEHDGDAGVPAVLVAVVGEMARLAERHEVRRPVVRGVVLHVAGGERDPGAADAGGLHDVRPGGIGAGGVASGPPLVVEPAPVGQAPELCAMRASAVLAPPAGGEVGEAALEARAVVAGARRGVLEDVAGIDAGGGERIALQVGGLADVGGGDAGVSDEQGNPGREVSVNLRRPHSVNGSRHTDAAERRGGTT
jgi:hypothetical protein